MNYLDFSSDFQPFQFLFETVPNTPTTSDIPSTSMPQVFFFCFFVLFFFSTSCSRAEYFDIFSLFFFPPCTVGIKKTPLNDNVSYFFLSWLDLDPVIWSFQRSQSDSKSPQLSRTFLNILADLNHPFVWIFSGFPLIFYCFNFFLRPFQTHQLQSISLPPVCLKFFFFFFFFFYFLVKGWIFWHLFTFLFPSLHRWNKKLH